MKVLITYLHQHDELWESLHRFQHKTVQVKPIFAFRLTLAQKREELGLSDASFADRVHCCGEVIDEITVTLQHHELRKLQKSNLHYTRSITLKRIRVS